MKILKRSLLDTDRNAFAKAISFLQKFGGDFTLREHNPPETARIFYIQYDRVFKVFDALMEQVRSIHEINQPVDPGVCLSDRVVRLNNRFGALRYEIHLISEGVSRDHLGCALILAYLEAELHTLAFTLKEDKREVVTSVSEYVRSYPHHD